MEYNPPILPINPYILPINQYIYIYIYIYTRIFGPRFARPRFFRLTFRPRFYDSRNAIRIQVEGNTCCSNWSWLSEVLSWPLWPAPAASPHPSHRTTTMSSQTAGPPADHDHQWAQCQAIRPGGSRSQGNPLPETLVQEAG